MASLEGNMAELSLTLRRCVDLGGEARSKFGVAAEALLLLGVPILLLVPPKERKSQPVEDGVGAPVGKESKSVCGVEEEGPCCCCCCVCGCFCHNRCCCCCRSSPPAAEVEVLPKC